MALFQPFRALGYITDDVPFAVQRRGRETYVTVSVGKAWQVYNTAKLTLVFVGPQLKHITALACKGDLTFAAVRGGVVECRRMHRSGEYRGGHGGDILQLLVLGEQLLSLGRDGRLLVWRIGEYAAPQVTIQLGPSFQPTCLCHPDTYLNKVLVGGEGGALQLWNFAAGRLLYEFRGWGSAVRCLAPSPALDVVGVGLADGRAVIHNLRFDETLAQFANASGVGTNAELFLTGSAAQAARLAASGACTAISFRMGTGVPLMATGGGAGVITVWDLEQRKLHTVIRDAHDAPIVQLHFFPGEPLLMSAGADNSLKQWVFDAADGSARLLKFRSGHAAPPTVVRHYGPDGRRLLSAGQDRAFRVFSTIQDQQSHELSQRHTARRAKRLKVTEQELRLARVVALDACEVRERDWSNVLTAHEGDTAAYVWRLQHFSLGEHILRPPSKEQGRVPVAPVTAVCVSRCGNFGFVGTATGRVDRYNMQSGLHRGAYCRSHAEPPTAHEGAVYGICTDSCNRWVATGGYDGMLRVWDFKKRTLLGEIQVGVPISRLCHHPTTGLLAAACDDLVIRMYDVEARRLVRRFRGHTDRISDLQLSADCRWLLSASLDNTVRVWDVPGARVLQVMRLGSPVTSLSLSPATDLLATTHVEHRGVYLWANQLLFGSGGDVVASERPLDVRLPTVSSGRDKVGPAGVPEGVANGVSKHAGLDLQQMLGHTTGAAGTSRAAGAQQDAAGIDSEDRSSARDESGSEMESSDTDMADSSDDDVADAGALARRAKQQGSSQQPQQSVGMDLDGSSGSGAAYSARDATGTPCPLLPELVTLSMLPRTQWQNLAHLDTIRARNKPIEPPKKPEAAPFFLPTVAGADAGRNPVFELGGGAAGAAAGAGKAGRDPLAAKAAAAWGGGEDGDGSDEDDEAGVSLKVDFDREGSPGASSSSSDEDEQQQQQQAGSSSSQSEDDGGDRQGGAAPGPTPDRQLSRGGGRIVRSGGRGPASGLVALLHSCQQAGDWTSVVAYLRSLPPVQVDAQLREMQVLEGDGGDEGLRDLELLLEFLEAETTSNLNFEFVQALLRVVLQVHGDTILQSRALRERAQRIRARIGSSWRRVDGLLQGVRCMLTLLGNMQA